MPKRTLNLDEELFVKALARAVEEGDARFVDGHVARLDGLVEKVRDCLRELAQLQGRAHHMRDRGQRFEYDRTFSGPPVGVA
jgi:hypothetical protein